VGHVQGAGLAARGAIGRLVRVARLVGGVILGTARLTVGAGRLAARLVGQLAGLAKTIGFGMAWPAAALARLVGRAARLTAATARPARVVLTRAGQRVERSLEMRLGVTLRAPGRAGRIFLTTAGGLVLLIALGSVTLGMVGGGPTALRALPPVASSPAAASTSATVAAARPLTEVPGVPIAATRTFLLTTYAPGSGHRGTITPSSGQLLIGRDIKHLPRRGDDHLLTSEIVFPLLPAPPSCLARVQLRLTLVGGQGAMGDESPYPLAVYPSALTGLADGKIPAVVPTLDLLANRPRGDLDWTPYGPDPALRDTDGSGDTAGAADAADTGAAGTPGQPGPGAAPGRTARAVTADVTELYERWLEGMRTAKGQPSIAPGTPLVLAFRPAQTSILGTWQQTYGGAASATAPVLLWSRRVHCP